MKVYAVYEESNVTLLNEKEFQAYIDNLRGELLESGMYDNEDMDYFEGVEDPRVILEEYDYDYTFRTFAAS